MSAVLPRHPTPKVPNIIMADNPVWRILCSHYFHQRAEEQLPASLSEWDWANLNTNTRQHLFALLPIVTSGMLFEKQVSSPTGRTKNSANHKTTPEAFPVICSPPGQRTLLCPADREQHNLPEPSHQRDPAGTHFLPSARVHPRLRTIQMFHLGDMTAANQPLLWQDISPSSSAPKSISPGVSRVALYLHPRWLSPSRSPWAPFPQREPLQHLPGPATSSRRPPPLRRGLHTAGTEK